MDPIETGLTAEQILNSPVYINARTSVERAVMNSLKRLEHDGKPETDRKKDLYWCMLKVLEMTHNQLSLAIAQGKIDEKKIANIGKKWSRL